MRRLFVAAAIAAGAAAWVEAAPRHGYSDTPFLPGSEWRVHDIRRPLPPRAEPGTNTVERPAGAVVLFDGKDLSLWDGVREGAVAGDSLDIVQTGQIQTKQAFGDCQLHVEWAAPEKPDGDAMTWGNSGVFLMGLYEVQIIQSEIYADGMAGAVYGQTPPSSYPIRPAGEWNVYDITFKAPKFRDGKLASPARVTLLFNGVKVQDNTEILGSTRHKSLPAYDAAAGKGPVMLQQHGSHVRYRNIWIRPMGEP